MDNNEEKAQYTFEPIDDQPVGAAQQPGQTPEAAEEPQFEQPNAAPQFEQPDAAPQPPYGAQQPYGAYPPPYGAYSQMPYAAPQPPYGAYSQPPYQQPWNPDEQPGKKRRKKKDRKALKLGLLIVAVALVAGVGGAVLSGVIQNLSERNARELSEKEQVSEERQEEAKEPEQLPAEEKAPVTPEQRYELSPLPETIHSNIADKSLTPKEVYAMNVGAVCGIATQVTTTNIWGQTSLAACSGSGFVLSEDGYIITNNHVVEDAQSVSVTLYSGEEYDAQVIGTDSMNDVALLKIEAAGLQTVFIADSDQIEVGEEVIAIGNPLGELTFTMTAGCISALDREINTDGTPINMLQTDAAINSGNSGGPLFDMDGNVIGITTAKYSGSTSSGTSIEGIGFAIPINDVMRIVYDLREFGYVKSRPYLGVTLQDLDSTTVQTYNLPVGPIVMSVSEGSCAEQGGIEEGDIIIGYDGEQVQSYSELVSKMSRNVAGDQVTVTVFRSGASIELELTLGERPRDEEIEAAEEEASQPEQQQQPSQGDGTQPFFYYPDPFGFFGFGN